MARVKHSVSIVFIVRVLGVECQVSRGSGIVTDP